MLSPGTEFYASFGDRAMSAWVIGRHARGKRRCPLRPNSDRERGFLQEVMSALLQKVDMCSADIPKFASNNRQKGTDAENKAVVQGVLAYYGTYEVDEGNKSLIMRIEYSSFPNINGAEQRRTIKLENDELIVINRGAVSGGTANLIWKRLK
jgi:hypothetical protein